MRVVQIEHRIADSTKFDPLVSSRQKTASPKPIVQRLPSRAPRSRRNHRHESRQIFIHASQAIGKPRTDRRAARDLRAGLEKRDSRIVIDRLRVHRFDKAQFIGYAGHIRHQFAHPGTAVSMLLEIENRGRHRKTLLPGRHSGQPLPLPNGIRQVLIELVRQLRFVIDRRIRCIRQGRCE